MADNYSSQIAIWYRDWFRNERLYDAWARRHGYNYNELFVLYLLNSTGGCTPSYMAEFLSLSKQSVNGILNRLDQRQMIRRIRSDPDRRKCLIVLTPEAAQSVAGIMAELGEIENRVFGSLGKDNIGKMIELNCRLTDSFMVTMQEEEKK